MSDTSLQQPPDVDLEDLDPIDDPEDATATFTDTINSLLDLRSTFEYMLGQIIKLQRIEALAQEFYSESYCCDGDTFENKTFCNHGDALPWLKVQRAAFALSTRADDLIFSGLEWRALRNAVLALPDLAV
jgi:hypothetical protein